MILEWQCQGQMQGFTQKGAIVYQRCEEASPEMNLVGGKFLCPYHAYEALLENPDAEVHLVRMPPHLQRKIREAEARQTK